MRRIVSIVPAVASCSRSLMFDGLQFSFPLRVGGTDISGKEKEDTLA